jgi:alkaline phosphatase
MTVKLRFLLFLFLIPCKSLTAQDQSCKGHSHNDYKQKKPFFTAYQSKMASIEADIWEKDGDLYVAHEKNEIRKKNTLDALYIQPIVKIFNENGGRAWKSSEQVFQLLIELKSPTVQTLNLLIQKLNVHQEVFDCKANKYAVRIAITGNIPPKETFTDYPDFIRFDGGIDESYTNEQLKKIALVSDNLEIFSNWKAKGAIPEQDREILLNAVNAAHAKGLKIRFWNAPDNPETWSEFIKLGIDFINTDQPEMYNKYHPCSE